MTIKTDKQLQFLDLLLGMLEYNPEYRLSVEEIINHPFLH